jgi:TM2 domain-containing membrane protein YozV
MSDSLSVEQLTYIEARLANEKKSVVVAYLLWFFLGWFGAHNFYMGRTLYGVLQLLGSVIGFGTLWFAVGAVPIGIVAISLFVDLFLIPGGIRNDLDAKRALMIAEANKTA